MIVLLGIVEVGGRIAYRRGFFVKRDGWRWLAKRWALHLAEPREGEVVRLVDLAGEEVARIESGREVVER